MIEVRYVQINDQDFWYRYDKHLPEQEFENKVKDKKGYILLEDYQSIGLLRYNLFWDNIPFCTMIYIDQNFQKKDYGTKLIKHWEAEMRSKGYGMVLTSTQVDENAQYFYRKLGYQDCDGLIINIERYKQPMELFLSKNI